MKGVFKKRQTHRVLILIVSEMALSMAIYVAKGNSEYSSDYNHNSEIIPSLYKIFNIIIYGKIRENIFLYKRISVSFSVNKSFFVQIFLSLTR